MFNYYAFGLAVGTIRERYKQHSPTVAAWCHYLTTSEGHQITLADLSLVTKLYTEPTRLPPGEAASMVDELNLRCFRTIPPLPEKANENSSPPHDTDQGE